MNVAMSDAARTVCRPRLRMKYIVQRSDPLLFVGGREKIANVNIGGCAIYIVHVGHAQTHTHNLQYIATCNPYIECCHTLPVYCCLLPSRVPQNPVGAGQYMVDSGRKHQHANGCKSVFSSTTPRLPENVDSPKERLLR